MSRQSQIVTNSLILLALIGCGIGVGMLGRDRNQTNICKVVQVHIQDTSVFQYLRPASIHAIIDSSAFNPVGLHVSEIATSQIEALVNSHLYVIDTEVYTTINGECVIEIAPRRPILRINTADGYDFYIDSSYRILPTLPKVACKLLIINGYLELSFPKDFFGDLDEKNNAKELESLKNLINFAKTLQNDEVLNTLITQIWVQRTGEIDLIPRIGTQTIHFGAMEDIDEKLDKLKIFYIESFKNGWWETTNNVILDFEKQIIIN